MPRSTPGSLHGRRASHACSPSGHSPTAGRGVTLWSRLPPQRSPARPPESPARLALWSDHRVPDAPTEVAGPPGVRACPPRWPDSGRRVGRWDPGICCEERSRAGPAPSSSERASGAGGAICNRADATTAPYSRGAGAGGQVTAAHPAPRSRVVPAREEPPGAL